MPIIDTFLRVMVEKRAEQLQLVADGVPVLVKDGQSIDLSMPALRDEMLRRIVDEIGAETPAWPPAAPAEGNFLAADGSEVAYRIDVGADGLRLEFRPTAAATAGSPGDDEDPLASEVAAFTGRQSLVAEPQEAPRAPSPSPDRRPTVFAMLQQAVDRRASDLFLSSAKPPRLRVDGQLETIDAPPVADDDLLALLPDARAADELRSRGSVDVALAAEGQGRFRVNLFRHHGGLAAAIRPIRREIPTLDALGMPHDLTDLVAFGSGLVLVTGPSGSGKSTTLAALVDHLNRTRDRHILTIEDPIEFEHRERRCLIHQREVGTSVESFSSALHAALRENPDVILLGEARDLATISAALTAAETGHLVLATLHSGSASLAINRIVDVYPGHQQAHVRLQLASSLRAVISQRLVATTDGSRVPAIERLMVTPPVAHGIREGQDHLLRDAMLTGGDEGMITLERSLAALVRKGRIRRDTAIRQSSDPKALLRLLE